MYMDQGLKYNDSAYAVLIGTYCADLGEELQLCNQEIKNFISQYKRRIAGHYRVCSTTGENIAKVFEKCAHVFYSFYEEYLFETLSFEE